MESFKEIEFDGTLFRVGDCGTIFRNGALANLIETPDGYLQVSCKYRSIGVHRLVALCFVDGRSDVRNEVNHMDFNRKNNRAENLEWVSHAENIKYSTLFGKKRDMSGVNNPNYGNKKLSNFYRSNPEIARQNQSRSGSQNGRARQVDVYLGEKFIGHFSYLGECWEYMRVHYGFKMDAETFRLGIRRSNHFNKPYYGFTFVKK